MKPFVIHRNGLSECFVNAGHTSHVLQIDYFLWKEDDRMKHPTDSSSIEIWTLDLYIYNTVS